MQNTTQPNGISSFYPLKMIHGCHKPVTDYAYNYSVRIFKLPLTKIQGIVPL